MRSGRGAVVLVVMLLVPIAVAGDGTAIGQPASGQGTTGGQRDSAAFVVRGPGGTVDYANSGDLTSGDVRIARTRKGVPWAVRAGGRIPGVHGGDLRFSVALVRVLPATGFLGFVVLEDRAADHRSVTPAFLAKATFTGQTARGTLRWYADSAGHKGPYTVEWTLTDTKTLPEPGYAIDPSLAPDPEVVPDGRGGENVLAVVKDESGTESTFIANRIVVRPAAPAELAGLLQRTGGVVIDDNAVPDAPDGRSIDPAFKQATSYTVRVDAPPVGGDFAGNAAALGITGTSTISSESGARLLALVAREAVSGVDVGPDFLVEEQWLKSTSEGNGADGLTMESAFAVTGNRSGTAAAWQYLSARPALGRVDVAIVDRGFWLDGQGAPLTAGAIGSDLPPNPSQYDLVEVDQTAGGENSGGCGGACPWHGNDSAGVATGQANDAEAAIGTGGFVADPMLFRFDMSNSQANEAVRLAAGWGAEVVNMSFSGECGAWCRFWDGFDFEEALDRGIVLVAAAGNGGDDQVADDVREHDSYPCLEDGVICVGALETDTNTSKPYSNYGDGVDVWAPTDITVMPNGASSPALDEMGGTSAAAPFVAGVAAILKAMDPALTSDAVAGLLRDTAWTDSPDPRVTHYLNALGAVRKATGNTLTPDTFEPNDTRESARAILPGLAADRTVHRAGDTDWHAFEAGTAGTATITATSPADLGRLGLLVDDDVSSCGEVRERTAVSSPGRVSKTYEMTRGLHRLLVSGLSGAVLPYDLSIDWRTGGTESDPYDVPLGRNNSWISATALPDDVASEQRVALAPAGDVDVYRIDSDGGFDHPILGRLANRFAVTSADMPVTLQLLDYLGRPVPGAVATSGPNCDPLPYLDIPAGEHYVQVTGAGAGGYGFVLRHVYTQGRLFDMRAFWRMLLDPGEAVEFHVRDRFERFAYRLDSESGMRLALESDGLHLRVLDIDGNVLAEGAEERRENRRYETVHVPEATGGDTYVLELTRLDELAGLDFEGVRLPAVRGLLVEE